MGTLKEQMAADLASVFYNTDEFAESVTYNPSGGTSKTIKAIFPCGDADEYRGSNSFGVATAMTCMVSDVPVVTNKDTVSIDGVTWGVIGADKINDGLEWKIELNKDTDT